MPSDSSTSANRIVQRYQFEARFKILVQRTEGTLEIEGWARDLSESGLGAFAAKPIFLGECATLRIPLPNTVDLVIPSIVARKVGTQYGFRFTALSSEQRRQILRMLAGKKAIPFSAAT